MGKPQRGRLFLIKSGDGQEPEQFTTVAGLRTKGLSINGEMIDVTDSDSEDQQRELLEGGGVLSMTITGAGVFEDDESQTLIEGRVIARSIDNYQVVFDSGRTYEGPFQATVVDYAGEYNGEHTYTVTLESAGKITIVPAGA